MTIQRHSIWSKQVNTVLRMCLTAGPKLADVLWSANVLPYLRRALPSAHLAWECPVLEAGGLLRLYPELDMVVNDVEEMRIAPDVYLILHPLWFSGDSPADGLFALIRDFCPPPASLPSRAYCPPAAAEAPPLPGLPETYICFDPDLKEENSPSERTREDLAAILAGLPHPAVQIGAEATPLLPGAIDSRGGDALAALRAIRHACLFIGGDGDGSVQAGALGKKQIWIETAGGSWRWPRDGSPACYPYQTESLDYLDPPGLIELAAGILAS